MTNLPPMLTADEDSGEFEPTDGFLELDTLAQLDIVGDWQYDLEQYRQHLLWSLFNALEKKKKNELSREEKLAAFRTVAANLGLDMPDDFESFVDAHRGMTFLPIKPRSCPVCNPADD